MEVLSKRLEGKVGMRKEISYRVEEEGFFSRIYQKEVQ